MKPIVVIPCLRSVGETLLNPYLTGVYVLAATSSAAVLLVCAFGYGAMWPADVLLILIGSLFMTAIVLATGVQWSLWRKLYPTSDPSLRLPLARAFSYSLVLLVVSVATGRLVGDGLRTALTWRICRECQPLLDELAAYRREHQVFPKDIRALHSYRLLTRYRSVNLVQEAKGGEELCWNLDELDKAQVSLFVLPGRFQCVVPIERSSPISFSHFRVYVFDFPENKWRRTLIHWSLLGVYMD